MNGRSVALDWPKGCFSIDWDRTAGPSHLRTLPASAVVAYPMDGRVQANCHKEPKVWPIPCQDQWRNFLRRICSWRIPPNWNKADWFEEICAVAMAAACEAELSFDRSRGISLVVFVRSRVLARTLTRYRQEWKFAHRCVGQKLEEGNGDITAGTLDYIIGANHEPYAHDAVLEALARLNERQRFVIEQLFWLERTEVEIGLKLGISQRSVSKRKLAALRALREEVGDATEHGSRPSQFHIRRNIARRINNNALLGFQIPQ